MPRNNPKQVRAKSSKPKRTPAKSTKDWKHRAVDDAKVTAAFNRAVNP